MFALEIELLGGRYVATAYNDRRQAEWPPHPSRLFSALVATWAEGEPTREAEEELLALRWLERQAAPEILASATTRAGRRTVVPVFVPVNDTSVVALPDTTKRDEAAKALAAATDDKARAKAQHELAKQQAKLAAELQKALAAPSKAAKGSAAAGAAVLPDSRTKQPRTFPTATPEQATFAFVWRDAELPAELATAMDRLAARVVRLGHSSSLVAVRVATAGAIEALRARTTSFVPDAARGRLVIRWVDDGQIERLKRAYARHREVEPRVAPARFVTYREGASADPTAPPATVFDDDFIVLARTSGPRLPITSAVGLSRLTRRALMAHAGDPVPELLSGHAADGAATDRPHLAIVPLPVVVGPHADGAILGLALVLPRAEHASPDERRRVLVALARLEEANRRDGDEDPPMIPLLLGDAGVLTVRRVAWGEDRRATLRPRTWTAAARRWASATPIALDRNPGDLHDPDARRRRDAFDAARELVVEAVRRIGLPAPVELDVVRSCVLAGSTKPRSFPRFPVDRARPQRVLVHVRMEFAQAVRGPLLIGAGRYQGLGLCLPLVDEREVA